MDEKISERYRKCRELAERASTPGEAAAAAAACRRLSLAHDITEGECGIDGPEFVRLDVDTPNTRPLKVLAITLCSLHDCCLLTSGRRKGLGFVGRARDVQAVVYSFDFIRQAMERQAVDYRREKLARWNAMRMPKQLRMIRSDMFDWRLGFATGFHDQLKEAIQREENQTGTALVVTGRQEAVVRHLKNDGYGEKKPVRVVIDPTSGSWAVGYRAGQSTEIRPGISGEAAHA